MPVLPPKVTCSLPACKAVAPKRCARCKSASYCSVEHQKEHWSTHKATCVKKVEAPGGEVELDSTTLHKMEFDRIVAKYKLDSDKKSGAIADFLTNTDEGEHITAEAFAAKFSMTIEDAVIFLGWIKVGVDFKKETMANSNAI